MQWQDLVLTIGQLIFVVSLLPSILSAVVLFVFALIDITLSLWFTSISVAITAVGWTILAYQKYMIDRKALK